jgi:hypothetical protein
MRISLEAINNLLGFLDAGLVSGAGELPGQHCVQQAVSMAVASIKTDSPWCVHQRIRQLGIHLNDTPGWSSEQARSKGLRRFAVAEMGTEENFDIKDFNERLAQKLDVANSEDPSSIFAHWFEHLQNWPTRELAMTHFANICADIFLEMETPGSEYLHYCDEQFSKREAKKIVKQETKKAYAAGLCNFGTCGMQTAVKQ